MNYFIYTSHHFTPRGRYELNKLTSLPICGFIAQLVEHRTGIAEVTGLNPVEALIFQASSFRLHKLEIYCDDHSSLPNMCILEMKSQIQNVSTSSSVLVYAAVFAF